MQLIASSIIPNSQGVEVINLQDGLLLLIHRQLIRLSDQERQNYEIHLSGVSREPGYNDVTQSLVTIFRSQYSLPAIANGKLDSATADKLNQLLRQIGAIDVEQELPTFTVEGTVASLSQVEVENLRVEIVDKNIGEDIRLAEANTDNSGKYRATFVIADLQQRGKQQPDFQVRIFSEETRLAVSEIRYNASTQETLNVLLSEAASTTLPTEYASLITKLAQYYPGQIKDLQETTEHQDITYLANKTGLDKHQVAIAALADQFSGRTADASGNGAIEPALFYTLFRAGLAADEMTLYRTDPQRLTTIWKEGIEQRIVPPELEARIPNALEQFQRIAVERILRGIPLPTTIPVGENQFIALQALTIVAELPSVRGVLDLSLGVDEDRHQKFAELQVQHGSNPPIFWDLVQTEFGEQVSQRLQLDGQLADLTINNVPLISKLHEHAGDTGLSNTISLVSQGFYQTEKWQEVIGTDTEIPSEIAGKSDTEKRSNYANLLATQIQLSYPTAVIAQMVNTEQIALTTPETPKQNVVAFLQEHQGNFELGTQPIERYVAANNLPITPELEQVVKEVTRIQRVHQITPNDIAMQALLKQQGLDSAYAVVRFGREAFVQTFKDEMGGETNARLTYAKAEQVHNTVLNLAVSYQLARTAPAIGSNTNGLMVNSAPNVPISTAANAGDVIAYPTMEGLFGELDYCTCEHCRSYLSPAAYLVDLLMFIDPSDEKWQQYIKEWKTNHNTVPYPFANQTAWETYTNNWNSLHPGEAIPNTEISPLQVLLNRRPDIQHLPLTCENTNGLVPHIDLVNETLEYFVTHNLKLENYSGHDTDDDATPEELLTRPQFVIDNAYTTLAGKALQEGAPLPLLPPTSPLPFHQPLENLRRYFDYFETPLPTAMELLRKDDSLERADENGYGWRDILLENLRFSRPEYILLTDRSRTLQDLFGYLPGTPEIDLLSNLSNVKAFTRRLNITYGEIVNLLQTRFINPNYTLIPKLERLRVPFATLKTLKENPLTGQPWLDLLPTPLPDASHYGGNIETWVKNEANFAKIMGLITLADPTNRGDVCSFDHLEFRYANPDNLASLVRPIEFIRLIRFIRLWKKLGWSIEQTDKIITALYPTEQTLEDPDNTVNLQRLDAGFKILLPRIGILKQVMESLVLNPTRDLLPLLACFSPIDTDGSGSLYRQMFLSPAILQQSPIFADNGFGEVLGDRTQTLLDQTETLRAAFQLTDDEFSAIAAALPTDPALIDRDESNTLLLTLKNISAVFRRGWLAHTLKLSVREFLLLTQVTGIDPFAAPDAPNPPIQHLINFLDRLRAVSLPLGQALYLIWNQDISGKSAPTQSDFLQFARTLRTDFATIASEFMRVDDPEGQIARDRMVLVYGNKTTDFFFGLLHQTIITTVQYSHSQEELEPTILAVAPGRIAYDKFRKQLSFIGVLSAETRDLIKAAAPAMPEFLQRIDDLFLENQNAIRPSFERYPELLLFYETYLNSNEPDDLKRTNLIANFLPQLQRRRNRQQALQAIGALAKVDLEFANTLLDNKFDDKFVLNAAALDHPALDDLMAIEADKTTITSSWNGYVEAPDNGFYNFQIKSAPGATVTLTLNAQSQALTPNADLSQWNNNNPIELRAGILYPIAVSMENAGDGSTVRWQTTSRGWEIIPARYLYNETLIDRLRTVYIRFLKSVSLAAALKLTANEITHFAKHPDYKIDTQSWLNYLPITGSTDITTSIALLKALTGLLDFAHLKSELSADDERLLNILKDPAVATQNLDSLLFRLTRWESRSLNTLLTHFGKVIGNLTQIETFHRVYNAFGLAKKMGIPVSALTQAVTNEPTADIAINLQSALRARYDEKSWLSVLKPINDEMRRLQRDALVAYILHQMRSNPETAHIDTPDKLFEYFLMDVQMEPCMQTSRIRHALSSVQLFIERSLMNLEPRVFPTAIDSTQWPWRKRYRMWEANRKIFLYPENWLEPELRDDQSPFFKETMSELLQSDITEDKAATALITYLSKLDEVAKLEPCGIHVVENDPGTADDMVHVVARTAGANRKYYYRRCENGSWTAWEQIKLDIEDNPVTPLVWKGRTFLFWLRILKQAPQNQQTPINAPAGTPLASLTTNQVTSAIPEMNVQVVLCWSEYYNGKWQPTKTSDINKPALLGFFKPQEFDRTQLKLGLYGENQLKLRVNGEQEQLKILISLSAPRYEEVLFIMRNTHSLPLISGPWNDDYFKNSIFGEELKHSPLLRSLEKSESEPENLSLRVKTEAENSQLFQVLNVLPNSSANHNTIEPQHFLSNSLEAPFIYEDNNHVFYVTTETSKVTRKFKAITTDNNVFYVVLDSGKLLWFRDNQRNGTNASNGSTGWDPRSGARISQGWQNFKFVFLGGDGIIYAVKPTGELLFYQDNLRNGSNAPDGSTGWHPNSGKQIGYGWQNFKFIFSGGNGVIYAVQPTGELLFYKDIARDGSNAPDGSTGWHPNSGSQIGSGWQVFILLISGENGVIYGVLPTGELLWYQYLGTGEFNWTNNNGSQIGTGWNNFRFLLSGGNGIIYGVHPTGEVRWYQYLGNGEFNWHPNSRNQINQGWI
jgi:Neuraminidase-like domain/Tachylectin